MAQVNATNLDNLLAGAPGNTRKIITKNGANSSGAVEIQNPPAEDPQAKKALASASSGESKSSQFTATPRPIPERGTGTNIDRLV